MGTHFKALCNCSLKLIQLSNEVVNWSLKIIQLSNEVIKITVIYDHKVIKVETGRLFSLKIMHLPVGILNQFVALTT